VGGAGAGGRVVIHVDGRAVMAAPGLSVAAALLAAGISTLRHSPTAGTPRGAFCLMGVCQECTVLIEGRAERACMTAVRDGLAVTLRGPHAA
jgi:predicted molibdopterin-dependent oxidoreductase YjgC